MQDAGRQRVSLLNQLIYSNGASPQSVLLAPLQGRNGNEILGKPRAPRFAFFGLVGPLHSISWGHLAIAAWRIIILPPVPETMPDSGRQRL